MPKPILSPFLDKLPLRNGQYVVAGLTKFEKGGEYC